MCAVELSGVKSGCQTIGLQWLKDSLIKSSVWELIICYRDWKERKDLFVLCVAKWCPMMAQMVKMMVAGTTIPTKEDQNNHTFCRWEGKQIHDEKNYIFQKCLAFFLRHNCYQQKMIIITTTTSSSSLTYKYWQLPSHFSTGNNICSQRWNLQPLFCPTTGAAGAGELKWKKISRMQLLRQMARKVTLFEDFSAVSISQWYGIGIGDMINI